MAKQINFDNTLYLQGEELVLDNGSNAGVIKSNNGIVQIDAAAIITGDLTVQGTTTTVNSTTLTIDDKNIELGSIGSPTDITADGGGITLKGATDKTILWIDSTDTWDFNQKVKSTNGFEGNLTGNSTGLHFGGLDTQGQDLISGGLSELNDVRIWGGTINATTIGAVTPSTGTFSTITGDGANITNVLSNYTTTNLTEGTNKYFTNARIDAHLNQSNPNPGYVLSWNGTDYVWGPTSLANHSIDALNDVDTTTVAPTTNQTIIWNGTNFVPGESFSQADFNTAFTAKDTDDLSEGTTNLYYTDARAKAVSINNLVEDTTPQLGGNLDLNTFDLTTTDNFATLTTSKSSGSTSTVVASSETNLSNTTVTVNDDGDYANSVSSFVTLTSTQIDTLGFKGESSLSYFGAAAPTSNFVFIDTGDNVQQNSMVVVYHTPTDKYTFTLASQHADNDAGTDGNQNQLNISAADADIKFKQYAYGEITTTSSTVLTTANTQFKDSGGFDIGSDDVTITNTGGTNYKIVFWTHDVGVGDVITVIHPPEGNTIFGWGGITTPAGRLTLLDSSGDLIYKLPATDGTANQVLKTDGSGDLSWFTSSAGFDGAFSSLTSKPTTLAGYGITDGGGSVTASSTDTFTNKSGAISQWTNDSGFITTMPLTLIKTLTANYTTVTADHGYYIRINTTNNVTVTLVSDSTENIPIGTTMIIGKLNTGSVTISAGAGATVITPTGNSISTQYGKVTVMKTGANTWEINGDLS